MTPPAVLRWLPLATQCANIVTANEILAIIWNESTGNPQAVNPSDPSYGLMQVTIPIARFYGPFESIYTSDAIAMLLTSDPERNVQIGSAFLADLKRKYAASHPLSLPDGSVNPNGWVTAYNQGEGNLLRGRADIAYALAFTQHLQDLETEQEPT
jgi:soluble lytic murein transglycosylase-like protein